MPRASGRPPRFFASQAEFRRWLEKNHASRPELWVGFYRKGSGRGGIGYKEAVDEALSFGWIDGLKKRVDAVSYMHRFTPRTRGSIWSAVNLARIQELMALGVVAAAGREAFERRDPKRAGRYSFENEEQALSPPLEQRFRANARAWRYFNAQPRGYRKVCTFFVMSAKKDDTRARRLDALIAASSQEKRLT